MRSFRLLPPLTITVTALLLAGCASAEPVATQETHGAIGSASNTPATPSAPEPTKEPSPEPVVTKEAPPVTPSTLSEISSRDYFDGDVYEKNINNSDDSYLKFDEWYAVDNGRQFMMKVARPLATETGALNEDGKEGLHVNLMVDIELMPDDHSAGMTLRDINFGAVGYKSEDGIQGPKDGIVEPLSYEQQRSRKLQTAVWSRADDEPEKWRSGNGIELKWALAYGDDRSRGRLVRDAWLPEGYGERFDFSVLIGAGRAMEEFKFSDVGVKY